MIVINAPYGFSAIWNIIRTWLSKETADKIVIFSAGDSQDALLRAIDVEDLPEVYGGKCNCEAQGGCAKGLTGPWMVGREERRQKWLRGEGELGITPSAWDDKRFILAGEKHQTIREEEGPLVETRNSQVSTESQSTLLPVEVAVEA